MSALVAALLLHGGAAAGPAQNWPTVNHDGRNTRANRVEKKISPTTVDRLAPRCRVDGLSAVTGTPAVIGAVVYFGDWSGVLHARRASDGTELSSRQLGSAIRPAPLVAGDRVYAAESNGTLHCVRRRTGELVWSMPPSASRGRSTSSSSKASTTSGSAART